ncbi:endo-alpha-N-acetylgalactosaminidase family protein [Sphingobacterium sp. UT-1RO-CII-1]|uniref:endo-alpha-N-acetylgalactosaminidase family protein n=1 Tax=Sphingobacterium sp. UT-1RO-CII-1 TaxID=2995225 RepID=UPI00227A61E1|nr:endo-alpha-N-acetylgalactosaminidase family protein [Sphingobacterium sp. UT-1RO-CII-1]MCY4780035.1 endo-alpha-N-acetylgalactosaminidase family protein [Sphingobacterium sp. UT-1RO-CII-1]
MHIGSILCMIFFPFFIIAQNPAPSGWRHHYDQTLVMKMFLAKPDGKGGSDISLKFEDVLSVVKYTDNMTLQVPKIIYLVGWQYNGHDDRYPAFFGVNEGLKRKEDRTALESLRWLIREAKKYNTTISLHINMTDAYEDSPLWHTYVEKDLIAKTGNGRLKVIGNYNGKKAYHINYKREWESGWAQKRIDALLSMIPELKQSGSIHLDAWLARPSEGHQEGEDVDMEYQKKVADYWLAHGIDPTTEWVMPYMVGRVPYYWHFNGQTQDNYLKQPAYLVTGAHFNPDLKKSDFGLEFLFGTSIYGETVFPRKRKFIHDTVWMANFSRDFYLNFMQYSFLNKLKRIGVSGEGRAREARFEDNVLVNLADSTITKEGNLLRKGDTLFLPVTWMKDSAWVAYSNSGASVVKQVPIEWKDVKQVSLYRVSKEGTVYDKELPVLDRQLLLELPPNTPYVIQPVN